MALSRVKSWSAGEVLTASDLNAEFNNILNNPVSLISPLTAALDMNGLELILDADADTSITADTDDQIDFKIGGTDEGKWTTGEFRVISGDAGAGAGPDLVLQRNSASPAAADAIGRVLFTGEDDGDNEHTYGSVEVVIDDETGGTEDGALSLKALVAATLTEIVQVSPDGVEFKDPADPTKIAKFAMSTISTSTTRTFTFPDADKTIGGTAISDVKVLAFAGTQNNHSGDGTVYTITYATEIFDTGSDFDGTSTFTAPETGQYLVSVRHSPGGLLSGHTENDLNIVASNRTFSHYSNPYAMSHSAIGDYATLVSTTLVDMDASDTLTVTTDTAGSTKVVDIAANDGDSLSICLMA